MTQECKQVLIVDDDVDMAESLSDILNFKGHSVEVAHSGPEAIGRCSEIAFDLVLMDVQMPGMSGIEAYHRLRERHPDLHVVFITGTGSEELINRMKRETVLDVIYKPLDLTRILSLVDEIEPRGQVLVADADPNYGKQVSNLLSAHGFASDIAGNVADVIDRLRSDNIDLLVLDLALPGFADEKTCAALTADIERKRPTVIISGYAAEGRGKNERAIENLIQLSSARRIDGHPAPIAMVALIEQVNEQSRGKPFDGQ